MNGLSLEIKRGEIFALLGPNGAGKTTLISAVCGLKNLSKGLIKIEGLDIVKHYRKVRALVGLVPQEIATESFETVTDTVNFSRGLFGLAPGPKFIEETLKSLSLWDKRDSKIMALSGGMKRRVMIAKALVHEPRILFLDEPTAGVDVKLRESMWDQVRALQNRGVTIILTTHYIEEAEEMADRIGIIHEGSLVHVDQTSEMLKKLGHKVLSVELENPDQNRLQSLFKHHKDIRLEGNKVIYSYDSFSGENEIGFVLKTLASENVHFKEVETKQSSLQDIFLKIVGKNK